jgi:glycosyl transferase family 25
MDSTDILIIVIIILMLILLFSFKLYKNMCFRKLNDTFTNKYKWSNYIDGIIYINLEKREDRKKLILEEFIKIDVPIEKINKISGIYIPKNGHKGCTQSHLLAITLAKLNEWGSVLIFEDDMELNVTPDEFNTNINNIMDYFSTNNIDWNVIMLGTAQETKTDISYNNISNNNISNNNIVTINSSSTGVSYIVNKNYYDILIELFNYSNTNMQKDKWTSDGWEEYALDQLWKKLQQKDKWYGFKNDLIKQRNISSTIMEINK